MSSISGNTSLLGWVRRCSTISHQVETSLIRDPPDHISAFHIDDFSANPVLVLLLQRTITVASRTMCGLLPKSATATVHSGCKKRAQAAMDADLEKVKGGK